MLTLPTNQQSWTKHGVQLLNTFLFNCFQYDTCFRLELCTIKEHDWIRHNWINDTSKNLPRSSISGILTRPIMIYLSFELETPKNTLREFISSNCIVIFSSRCPTIIIHSIMMCHQLPLKSYVYLLDWRE